jgi:very-short-patch-repair endonuclease
LRARETRSERILWDALRSRRFDGLKFRRQRPVGAFVLDFYCEELHLAIEIDGAIHLEPDVASRDAMRERDLREQGVRFIRVSARDVETDVVAVLEFVRRALTPVPSPTAEGEG